MSGASLPAEMQQAAQETPAAAASTTKHMYRLLLTILLKISLKPYRCWPAGGAAASRAGDAGCCRQHLAPGAEPAAERSFDCRRRHGGLLGGAQRRSDESRREDSGPRAGVAAAAACCGGAAAAAGGPRQGFLSAPLTAGQYSQERNLLLRLQALREHVKAAPAAPPPLTPARAPLPLRVASSTVAHHQHIVVRCITCVAKSSST